MKDMKSLSNKYITENLDDDIYRWKIRLEGPKTSPYEGFHYFIQLKFTTKYPFKAPSVSFITPIYHPNISHDGSICVTAFSSDWTPAYTSKIIVEDILPSLLTSPNPFSPLNTTAANLYINDREEYDRQIIIHSKQNTIN